MYSVVPMFLKQPSRKIFIMFSLKCFWVTWGWSLKLVSLGNKHHGFSSSWFFLICFKPGQVSQEIVQFIWLSMIHDINDFCFVTGGINRKDGPRSTSTTAPLPKFGPPMSHRRCRRQVSQPPQCDWEGLRPELEGFGEKEGSAAIGHWSAKCFLVFSLYHVHGHGDW